MQKLIDNSVLNFVGINTTISNEIIFDEKVIRVTKNKEIEKFDENTYAKLNELDFHNGVIEVKVLSRLLNDAPDYSRGFIGIAFRINEFDSEFECFYLRPTNGNTEDLIRKKRAFQYFAYPNYKFDYFRDLNITKYEGECDIDLNKWIDLKIIVNDETASFYVNDFDNPILIVDKLFNGSNKKGKIGLFVDVGTEGFFKDLCITNYD